MTRLPFSWDNYKKRMIEHEVEVSIQRAKRGSAEDKRLHPDWVRDAQKKDFTMLTKQVRESIAKYHADALTRRLKRHGKG